MDYSRFYEFPFPSDLSEGDRRLKNFFMSLSDEDQLSLLNGCTSYEDFHRKVSEEMVSREQKAAL